MSSVIEDTDLLYRVAQILPTVELDLKKLFTIWLPRMLNAYK